MLSEMATFFVSWFAHPSIVGILLAIVFGAIWLAAYRPPLLKKRWLWAVLATSAIITLIAVAFIQVPLQYLAQQLLRFFMSQEEFASGLLYTGIPFILLSGLVQEGAKLIPVVIYWWDEDKHLDPKLGLIIGAVAGAGFGMMESQWALNAIFASGWTWEAVTTSGVVALAGFWERFFNTALHAALSGMAGYSLARGWGWQGYLVMSFLHGLANYAVLLVQAGTISVIGAETYIFLFALIVSALALWLRWRRTGGAVPVGQAES